MLYIIAIVYLLALLLAFVFQRNFIYFPTGQPAPAGFERFLDVKAVDIEVEGVGDITSYYSAPLANRPLIIVFHGNGSENYHLTAEIQSFHDWDVGILMASYPGYGINPGKPSEETFFASAEAHYEWAIAQGIDPQNIVLYGHSLGAASAVHVASERDIGALILSSPFLSARAMGRRQMPFFPTGLLLKDQFRSDLKMPNVKAPLYVFHGTKDNVIPHKMGKALAALHPNSGTFMSIENGGHNNLWGMNLSDNIENIIHSKYRSSATPNEEN